MKKFVYVFNAEARDQLLSYGFELINSDEANQIYVFLNQPNKKFALYDISSIESDTLRFN